MQIVENTILAQVGGGSSELQGELNPPSALDVTRSRGWHVGQDLGMIYQIATVFMPMQWNS